MHWCLEIQTVSLVTESYFCSGIYLMATYWVCHAEAFGAQSMQPAFPCNGHRVAGLLSSDPCMEASQAMGPSGPQWKREPGQEGVLVTGC